MSGTTNVHLQHVIAELKKSSAQNDVQLWKRVAEDLEKSTRRRRVVNLSNLGRFTKPNEVVVVPGKVLGSGEILHSLTVAAWDFSGSARASIQAAKGTCLSLLDLIKKEPKGKNVRIIG